MLDLSKSPIVNWSWRDHFGFSPAVLVTLDVVESADCPDAYPDKAKHPLDRIASLKSLQHSLQKVYS